MRPSPFEPQLHSLAISPMPLVLARFHLVGTIELALFASHCQNKHLILNRFSSCTLATSMFQNDNGQGLCPWTNCQISKRVL